MMACSHGNTYLTAGGTGRSRYTYCRMCRSLQELEPSEAAKAEKFLKENGLNDDKPKQKCNECGQIVNVYFGKLIKHDRDGSRCPGSGEKIISLTRVSDFKRISICDEDGKEKIGKNEAIHGGVEEDFLDSLAAKYGTLEKVWNTDWLKDTIAEIINLKAPSIRSVASKYNLRPDDVFELRLWVETDGLDLAVEKLFGRMEKRRRKNPESGQIGVMMEGVPVGTVLTVQEASFPTTSAL
jgi:DNA-directed RNA polymerase subunit RPC12/RpoP